MDRCNGHRKQFNECWLLLSLYSCLTIGWSLTKTEPVLPRPPPRLSGHKDSNPQWKPPGARYRFSLPTALVILYYIWSFRPIPFGPPGPWDLSPGQPTCPTSPLDVILLPEPPLPIGVSRQCGQLAWCILVYFLPLPGKMVTYPRATTRLNRLLPSLLANVPMLLRRSTHLPVPLVLTLQQLTDVPTFPKQRVLVALLINDG